MKSRSKKPRNESLNPKMLQGLNYSSLQTGCDMCLQRLNYNLTNLLKNDKAQKPKFVLGTNISESHNRF